MPEVDRPAPYYCRQPERLARSGTTQLFIDDLSGDAVGHGSTGERNPVDEGRRRAVYAHTARLAHVAPDLLAVPAQFEAGVEFI